MKTLARKKLDDFIVRWIAEDRPYLGICLGFQLLFERSEETPGLRGLSVFKGPVVRFREKDIRKISGQIRIWAGTPRDAFPEKRHWCFKGIGKEDYLYFVHSYFPEPANDENCGHKTNYGREFCSSVLQGNLFASQFHPEKSGRIGLRLLKNIISKVKKGKLNMLVIPAIDLKGGKCVRLKQGVAENETVYSDDPVAMAQKWVSLGAKRLHIVDLDGAFTGNPVNLEHVFNIKKATNAFIQLGGGFRTLSVIESVLAKGIDRIILGTMVYETAGEAEVALEKYPERFMVALDTKDGMVAIKGWKDVAEIPFRKHWV